MKTPIQELIDKLNNVKPTEFCSIETIKGWAEQMLEKEKEVIVRSYMNVSDDGDETLDDFHLREFAEDYYNKTFNSKSHD